MAVRAIDDNNITMLSEQRASTRFTNACRQRQSVRDPQASLFVLTSIGITLRFFDILDRDQSDTEASLVDDNQLLDPVFVQEAHRLVLRPTPSRTVTRPRFRR